MICHQLNLADNPRPSLENETSAKSSSHFSASSDSLARLSAFETFWFLPTRPAGWAGEACAEEGAWADMESADERVGSANDGRVDRGRAEDTFLGRAEGMRRTVCAPLGAAKSSAHRYERDSPLRASFHSCTFWTASSYTVNGFFCLTVPISALSTTGLTGFSLSLRSFEGIRVVFALGAEGSRDGGWDGGGEVSMFRRADSIQGCLSSFLAVIRRWGSF